MKSTFFLLTTANSYARYPPTCCTRPTTRSPQATAHSLSKLTNEASGSRCCYFGNGQWVHNLVEQGIIKAMAKRVMAMHPVVESTVLFSTIEECGAAEAARQFVHAKSSVAMPHAALASRSDTATAIRQLPSAELGTRQSGAQCINNVHRAPLHLLILLSNVYITAYTS